MAKGKKKTASRSGRYKCLNSMWANGWVLSKSKSCSAKNKDILGRCRRPSTKKDGKHGNLGGVGKRCYDTVISRYVTQDKCNRCPSASKWQGWQRGRMARS